MSKKTFSLLLALFLFNSFSWAARINEKRHSASLEKQATKNLFYEFGLATLQVSSAKKNYLKNFNTITYNSFDSFKLKTYLNYYLELNNQSSNDFSDLYNHFYVSNTSLGNQSRLETYIINILPISKNSQQTQTMYLALGGGADAKTQFTSSVSLIVIKFNISLIKFFYKKETGLNSISNTNLLSNQQLLLDLTGKQFGGQIYLKNSIANNFTGQQFSANSLTEVINWHISRVTKLGFGHSSSPDILNAKQEELPAALYQNNSSTFFISFNHIF